MAFLGITVPAEAAHLLSKIEVPGEKSDPSELHITLVYFGKTSDIAEISRCLPIIEAITHQKQPFAVKTSVVSHFPGHREDKCAVIAKIESPALHQLRAQLAEELDEHGIEYSKQFKEYRPHITLSYAEEEPSKDHKIQPIQFKVEEITLWGGEDMDDKIIVSFPLGQTHKHAELIREIELFEKLAGSPSKAKEILKLTQTFYKKATTSIAYHGGKAGLKSLDWTKTSSAHGTLGPGIYLTTDHSMASRYLTQPETALYTVEVDTSKLIPASGKEWMQIAPLVQSAKSYEQEFGKFPTYNNNTALKDWLSEHNNDKEEFVKVMRSHNISGTFGVDNGAPTFAVFDPQTIKIVSEKR